MTRLAALVALLVLFPSTAHTQERYVQRGDEYQLTRESPFVAVVEYLNNPAQLSPGRDIELAHDGLTVTVHTSVNVVGSAERVTVTAPVGWVSEPPFLDVEDGSSGTIILMRAEDQFM